MPLKIHNIDQRTQEWLELRKGRVTGSNAHILLTKGKDEAIEANNKQNFSNFYMKRGSALEKEAIEIYESKYGDVLQVGFVTNTDYPNAGASPDGISGEYLLEVKCYYGTKMLGISDETIPFEAMAQMQFNMMICELEKARLVMYNPDLEVNNAFKVIDIDIDYKIVKNIERTLK
jgi:putative phage-type endonuclease